MNIFGFYFENYYCGIFFNSSKTTITNNNLIKNAYGIYIIPSIRYHKDNLTDTIIMNNTVNNNLWTGIYLYDAYDSSNTIISRNIGNNNGEYGISIGASVINNGIVSNNIANNNNKYYGIGGSVYYGSFHIKK
ncbi:hypothetical protein ALNOE001_11950 [Candidatus Methanobinarius endosymbioticus]|uniref:Periplasmic copper-binding protein NosD beta helix domain-containing protein n=1 Tax=Candidatus Methanobinarius endosymbioticus TaxID=2006182 RepID=A0A366MBL8_9EURY|nr:hypothetical protein ALNOE001_11950 [Candidatus Methanobinarius endosymbioticus]